MTSWSTSTSAAVRDPSLARISGKLQVVGSLFVARIARSAIRDCCPAPTGVLPRWPCGAGSRRAKADSDQFDALAVPPGLMVRSRDLKSPQIPQPLCAASRTMGPPHPLRDGRYATIAVLGSVRTCALLRMRRIHGQQLVI